MLKIHIRQGGYLGNHMYQYMLAKTIANDINREADISGHHMEPWGLSAPVQDIPSHKVFEIRSNLFNYKKLIRAINEGQIDHVVIRSLAMRLEYYKSPEFYRPFFVPRPDDVKNVTAFDDTHLLIHIRGGDILGGVHQDYHPLPFNYYRHLIAATGLKPVFMGQITDDHHSQALQKAFPDCTFIEMQTIIEDFEMLRRAKNIAISTSSFAWLATWLSSDAKNIFCPLAGFMHPRQRPDIDLLPRKDTRYKFFEFPIWKFKASENDFDRIFGNGMAFQETQPRHIPYFETLGRSFWRDKKNAFNR